MPSPKAIFISYRRSDTDGFARLLHRQLLDWFHPDVVYFDQHSAESGMDYVQGIKAALGEVSVVLVLIGRHWIGEFAERARKGEPDLVVAEIEMALKNRDSREITVIPVLTGIDKEPPLAELPHALAQPIQSLFRLGHERLYYGRIGASAFQFTTLLDRLEKVPGVPKRVLHHEPESKRPFPAAISHRSTRFVDAEHRLDQLQEALVSAPRGERPLVSTICGMAGVGKSELALQFAFKHRDAFSGGVCWLPGSGVNALTQAAAESCRECFIPVNQDDDPCGVWRAWLEQTPKSCLIILDDLAAPEVASAVLPRMGPHSILITTRDVAADQATIIGPWADSTAASYLQECLRSHPFPAPLAQLRRLSRALGGVPLALAHAAAYLSRTGRRVEEYVDQLEDVAKAPVLLASLARREPLLATLRTSLDKCDEAAQRLLETLACFADQPVPERWLRSRSDLRSPADQAAVSDDVRWNELVAQLRSFALVDRVGTYPADMRLQEKLAGKRTQPALQLNRMTQQSLLAITPDGSTTRRVATQLLAQRAANEMRVAGRTAEYACLVDHLVFRATLEDDIESARLMRLTAELHRAKGNFDAARECASQWVLLCAELQRPDAAETVEARILEAEAVADLERFTEALPLAARAAADAMELGGQDGELHARACCLAARCAAELGDPGQALNLFQTKLLDGYLLGSAEVAVSPWVLRALHDFSNVLLQAGQTRTALWAQSKLLELAASEFGQSHDLTLQCAAALAKTWSSIGDHGRASQVWRLAAETRLAVSGPYHPDTIATSMGLANALLQLGNADEAARVFDVTLTWGNLTLPQGDERLCALRDGHKAAQQLLEDRAQQGRPQ